MMALPNDSAITSLYRRSCRRLPILCTGPVLTLTIAITCQPLQRLALSVLLLAYCSPRCAFVWGLWPCHVSWGSRVRYLPNGHTPLLAGLGQDLTVSDRYNHVVRVTAAQAG